MNEQEILKRIISLIDQIEKFDLSRLYPKGPNVQPWKNMSSDGLEKFVKKTMWLLEQIKDPSNEENIFSIGYDALNNTYNTLVGFISDFTPVSMLLDIGISNQHHTPLSRLFAFQSYLRSTGLYSDLKFDKGDIARNLEKANLLAKDILSNESSFKASIEVFKEAGKGKDEFVSSLISEKGKLFKDKAEEYKTYAIKKKKIFNLNSKHQRLNWYINHFYYLGGSFWALLISLIFGCLILYIVNDFIRVINSSKNITVGVAILRVSALIVPSYFAIFFVQRYIRSSKLYEFYNMKAISLSTMADLFSTYPTYQEKILDKATCIIFSEFSEKNDGELTQKDIMSFALDLAKKKS